MEMNQEVADYIQKLPAWQIEVCEALRKKIFHVIPEVTERLQYGKPHYLKNGHYACVIQGSKVKVTFTIFNAAELEEMKGFFEPTTSNERKTATIKEGVKVDYDLLEKLLAQASSGL